MHIGLTYDLRDDYRALGYDENTIAEFDSVETINALEEALQSHGYTTERIGNIWSLVDKLAAGSRWDLVFNLAEGLHGLAREAQVPALLDAYHIAYVFSSPDVMVVCHDKSLAKERVAKAGGATADYYVVQSADHIEQVTLPFPLFVKPLAEGTGKGVTEDSLVKNKEQLRRVCTQLLQHYQQPVLVETYLPGREFTVGIVGNGYQAKAIGALEVVLNDGAESVGHTYHNKEHCEQLITYRLCDDDQAKASIELALLAWRALGCFDGGRIDIRCDETGKPHFLELNPLAGIHPTHSDLPILASQAGISYNQLIGNIVSSAIERHGLALVRSSAKRTLV